MLLIDAGVIAEVRLDHSGSTSSTLKLRPCRPGQLNAFWSEFRRSAHHELRVEGDWVAGRRVVAASLIHCHLQQDKQTGPPQRQSSATTHSRWVRSILLGSPAPVPQTMLHRRPGHRRTAPALRASASSQLADQGPAVRREPRTMDPQHPAWEPRLHGHLSPRRARGCRARPACLLGYHTTQRDRSRRLPWITNAPTPGPLPRVIVGGQPLGESSNQGQHGLGPGCR